MVFCFLLLKCLKKDDLQLFILAFLLRTPWICCHLLLGVIHQAAVTRTGLTQVPCIALLKPAVFNELLLDHIQVYLDVILGLNHWAVCNSNLSSLLILLSIFVPWKLYQQKLYKYLTWLDLSVQAQQENCAAGAGWKAWPATGWIAALISPPLPLGYQDQKTSVWSSFGEFGLVLLRALLPAIEKRF